METKKFNFNHETQGNDRLYILWDNVWENETQIFAGEQEIEDYKESLGDRFTDFNQVESDYAVASHYGYDNCVIYSNE